MTGACKILLNKATEIPVANYGGFRLITSMKEGLPYGYFHIMDKDSNILAQFENLQIGAMVDISLTNTNEDLTITWPTFYILQIEDDGGINAPLIAGIIRVWFGHPWFLYKDVKNHAYKAMNNVELIKKVLQTEDRGMAFEVKDENFSKSDDSGEISRFKIGETDWDFIKNKIIPYTAINLMPAQFFCRENFEFMVKSVKDLYDENSKVMFTPKQEKLGEPGLSEQVKEIQDKNGIADGLSFPIQEITVKIGNRKIQKEILPKFYIENTVDGSYVAGGKLLSNKVKARSGDSFGNILPFDQVFIDNVKGTSIKIIHNRQTIDSLSLLLQTGQEVDNIFEIAIVTPFCGFALLTGDTAEIFLAPLDYGDGEKKKHWACGKWLVHKIEHFSSDDDTKQFLTKTYLLRSSFVGNDNSTSLSLSELMYEAV